MKRVYSYQEIGTLIDQGKQAIFTCHTIVRVSCVKKDPGSETITVILTALIRDTCVGVLEQEYSSIEEVLEAFDIDDFEELWEVLS
ncbi:MAG TPA: hypothetical protein VFA41_16580 [Ktedonobacteraceae bacterium]|jgi:hypothetical protein|nr:hypothetical protein [Ktedonobacteraceae bacterium]